MHAQNVLQRAAHADCAGFDRGLQSDVRVEDLENGGPAGGDPDVYTLGVAVGDDELASAREREVFAVDVECDHERSERVQCQPMTVGHLVGEMFDGTS
jgi:hypothetical protein